MQLLLVYGIGAFLSIVCTRGILSCAKVLLSAIFKSVCEREGY